MKRHPRHLARQNSQRPALRAESRPEPGWARSAPPANHSVRPSSGAQMAGRRTQFLPRSPQAFFLGALLLVAGIAEAQELKTEFLGSQQAFSHIAKTTANGVTTILISGQIGWADGAEAPAATLAEQAEIAFTNVVKRLEQAGASAEDIVKTNVYIKDIDPEKVQAAGRAHAKVLRLDPPRASTWVGVTGLVYPSLLIEVEATAVAAAEE